MRLRSRRWNFSSSTTKISDSLSPSDDKDSHLHLEMAGPTVGDVHRRLSSGLIGSMEPLSLNLLLESPLLEYPLPLESPLPLDSPLDSYSSVGGRGGGICISERRGWGGDHMSKEGEEELSKKDMNLSPDPSACISASVRRVKTEGVDKTCEGVSDRLRVLGLVSQDFVVGFQLWGRGS